jgi:hydrogenase expression/formation protein HypC
MCLAVPGKLLDCDESSGVREGRVQFGGIVRRIRLDFLPEAQVGDYVVVHVGFAISRVDAEEAQRTYQLLSEMGTLAEDLGLTAPSPSETLSTTKQKAAGEQVEAADLPRGSASTNSGAL